MGKDKKKKLEETRNLVALLLIWNLVLSILGFGIYLDNKDNNAIVYKDKKYYENAESFCNDIYNYTILLEVNDFRHLDNGKGNIWCKYDGNILIGWNDYKLNNFGIEVDS